MLYCANDWPGDCTRHDLAMRRSSSKASASADEDAAHGQQALDGLLHLAEVAATLDSLPPTGADGSSSAPDDQECLGYQFLDPALAAQQHLYSGHSEQQHAGVVPLQQVPLDGTASLVQSLLQRLQQHPTGLSAINAGSVSTVQHQGGFPATHLSNSAHAAAMTANPGFGGSAMLASTVAAAQQPHAPTIDGSSSLLQPSVRAALQPVAPTAAAGLQSPNTGLLASILSNLQPANAATLVAALGLSHAESTAGTSAGTQLLVHPHQQLHSASAAAADFDSDEEASGSAGLGAGPRTQRWTDEEHCRLEALVEHYGMKNWSTVAGHLPGRTGKQCRERYLNHTYKLRKVREKQTCT